MACERLGTDEVEDEQLKLVVLTFFKAPTKVKIDAK